MKKEYTQRYPIVNGLFYPDSKEDLENIIQGYIEKVDKEKLLENVIEQTGLTDAGERSPLVVIAPHAGYIFSGRVQAYSYCLIKDLDIQTAVIIGPAHQKHFKGLSVNLDNVYKTPAGLIEVDLELAELLVLQDSKIASNQEAHLREHSIEVQLPFLQIIQPEVKIVPILIGDQNWETSEILKNALISVTKKTGKKIVIIASTDLSHYHPHVEAQSLDKVLRSDVMNMDPRAFYKNVQEGNSEACGFGGMLTGMMLAGELGEGKSAELLYMDSGEVSGDRNKVVGYLSAAMY
jgi:AmmeMemoRadiSam system protein B